MIHFTGVLSKDIDSVWASVAPQLLRGLGEHDDLETLHSRLLKADAQLWIACDDDQLLAACATELVTLGTRKVCNIMTVGGTGLKHWVQYMEILEAWAKSNGCVAMRHEHSRPGWQRVLRDYSVKKITLEKVL